MHRCLASPLGRVNLALQDGQTLGNSHFGKFGGRFPRTGPTTSGITSPALLTITVSPGRTSFALTWSSLCNVAVETVTPPTKIGSSLAKGVADPAAPIDISISKSFVVCSSGGSLNAKAQRGAFAVAPRTA